MNNAGRDIRAGTGLDHVVSLDCGKCLVGKGYIAMGDILAMEITY